LFLMRLASATASSAPNLAARYAGRSASAVSCAIDQPAFALSRMQQDAPAPRLSAMAGIIYHIALGEPGMHR
jgi:hypothetical protein